jgi:RNA polymerase sigma-70 factor, ECF subfamily
VSLHPIDRQLLEHCLARQPKSWERFVDRYLGLVLHVIDHTARCRAIPLTSQDREDLTAEVFVTCLADDMAVLRRFRGESSLATYLTVVARRVVVRELLKRKPETPLSEGHAAHAALAQPNLEQRISNRDEVERLLRELNGSESQIVRMYHLEGKSYEEISRTLGVPVNSIGPSLSRARQKMRQAGVE